MHDIQILDLSPLLLCSKASVSGMATAGSQAVRLLCSAHHCGGWFPLPIAFIL